MILRNGNRALRLSSSAADYLEETAPRFLPSGDPFHPDVESFELLSAANAPGGSSEISVSPFFFRLAFHITTGMVH